MLSKSDLVAALRALGVRRGMELEVHSSLRSLGPVEGGAETVLSALMEAVGPEGSLFMPALCLSPELPLTDEDKRLGLTCKIRVLPPDAERTAMGLIADTFRKRPDVTVGEGVFRICAWGCSAARVDTGLQYLLDHGGMGLLIGVDIYKLTAMHYVESLLPPEIGAIFAPSEEARERYPEGEWLIEAGAPPVKAWHTIQRRARERGFIRDGRVGESPCMFFRLADVVGLYREALETDPLGLYGLR